MSLTLEMLPPQAGKGTTYRKGKRRQLFDSITIESLPLKLYTIPFPAYLNYSTLCLVCQGGGFIGINQLRKWGSGHSTHSRRRVVRILLTRGGFYRIL